MQPRQIGDTSNPVEPNLTQRIWGLLPAATSQPADRTLARVSSVMESDGYRRLFISASAVIFGVMGQSVARGWLAKDLTGSNAGLGGVMLAFGISMLLATPWGGVAADRFPKRTVLMIAVLMLVVSSGLKGLAVVTGVISY